MVRRIYAEKKAAFATMAKELFSEIKTYLQIDGVTNVRVLIRYDVENLSDEIFEKAARTVFSEPPVDEVYVVASTETAFAVDVRSRIFSVEYLPGQFDQRADSAEQCVKLLDATAEPVIRTATTYIIEGDITGDEFARIKSHCINPVDSREATEEIPATLRDDFEEPADIAVLDGFTTMPEEELNALYQSFNLAMTFKDFLHIQNYFANDEKRDPTMTEIRVLDTYWSDHCRHTTFSTELKNITFEDGYYAEVIRETYQDYRDNFQVLYKDRDDKFVCLMDLAVIAAKLLKAEGKLTDEEESDEINACSIVVPIEVTSESEDGTRETHTEEWLINFKNETHNHPTEIEPFGGAATCLGGAIRDPLSGRTYVYQAMRVTGAADPTVSVQDTLNGKLPQKKLVREAAHGYSSYGNQIGLATGLVNEIYHPDYVAKRMEIGAVLGAAPRRAVQRLTSDPGDKIILLGGRTGRDGIGGATGSSKAHTTASTELCGAEVQKGNPPTERKLQRLFRREEVAHIIKKCNDFGAGGVSVAIGELADGLSVDLDKVPKKYAGLDGTELAISESQERMAVVVAPEDVDKFLRYVDEENLEATEVAVVTEEPRLVLNWRGNDIVNISRAFLNTNGAHQETDVVVEIPDETKNYFHRHTISEIEPMLKGNAFAAAWLRVLADLNVCSQKGLVEMFDGSIGANSVFMLFGGKYQMTETQAMVAKVPVGKAGISATVFNGYAANSSDASIVFRTQHSVASTENDTDGVASLRDTSTVTLMSYAFDPILSSWSPYHGAQYACIESVAKIVAAGGDWKKIHFTFQEYFKRMTSNKHSFSQPLSALLGAYRAQMSLGLAAIGGKDSMSGSFNTDDGEIHVPPTLVSFAVAVGDVSEIITPELKAAGNELLLFRAPRDNYDLPDYRQITMLYEMIAMLIKNRDIVSAYALDGYGLAPALSKMAFGNGLGVSVQGSLAADDLFMPMNGSIVVEVPKDHIPQVSRIIHDNDMVRLMTPVGTVTDDRRFSYQGMVIDLEDAVKAWTGTLEKIFPTTAMAGATTIGDQLYVEKSPYVCKHPVAKPKVFIPVFPGTNCEYDSANAFARAGAEPVVRVFRNLTPAAIRESVDVFEKAIDEAQIVMFPGGFSAGDEPEGSAKFFANAFRNEKLKDALTRLLNERDGLILGVCNGFQALIKLGLLPYGEIRTQESDSPTLTYNTIGRHISKMVYTKVVSDKSPWLAGALLGETYVNPASHGEGRFVASDEWLDKLFENGQVATQYSDPDGNVTMDDAWNVNGSYMAIEGITSPDGRVLGKMAHSERRGNGVQINIYGEQDMKIFESGVEYFR